MNKLINKSMNQRINKSMNYKNVHLPTTATLSTGGLLIKGAPMTKMKKSNYERKFINMEILKYTFQKYKNKIKLLFFDKKC